MEKATLRQGGRTGVAAMRQPPPPTICTFCLRRGGVSPPVCKAKKSKQNNPSGAVAPAPFFGKCFLVCANIGKRTLLTVGGIPYAPACMEFYPDKRRRETVLSPMCFFPVLFPAPVLPPKFSRMSLTRRKSNMAPQPQGWGCHVGLPDRIRTCGLESRSLALYPAGLRVETVENISDR